MFNASGVLYESRRPRHYVPTMKHIDKRYTVAREATISMPEARRATSRKFCKSMKLSRQGSDQARQRRGV
ncbi:MAG: hypothetical protein MZU97_22140 [Bacillus subtilis]|nr:hypothetical protein [Bacillus subtilis]